MLILPLVFSANLYAGSSINDEELLGAIGKKFCANTKYLECLGLTNVGCMDVYMKTARVCITRHPLNEDMEPVESEFRKYGDCTAHEIRLVLSKHDSCSAHLETTFDQMEKDARSKLERSKSGMY